MEVSWYKDDNYLNLLDAGNCLLRKWIFPDEKKLQY